MEPVGRDFVGVRYYSPVLYRLIITMIHGDFCSGPEARSSTRYRVHVSVDRRSARPGDPAPAGSVPVLAHLERFKDRLLARVETGDDLVGADRRVRYGRVGLPADRRKG